VTSPDQPLNHDSSAPNTFLALDPDEHSLDASRVVLLPVPYDATTSYKHGARFGPSAIIAASAEMEDFDPELNCEPMGVGIHTAPALNASTPDPETMAGRVSEAVDWYAERGKLIGMLGGEHSLSAGAVRTIAACYTDLSVLVFDAQADLRDDYQGMAYSHACASRRMLDHAPVTLVGVRSMTGEEQAFAREQDIAMFERGADPITDVDAIVAALSNNVYVSFDLDAFDPSFMAAVGTPEPGGMGWWEALRILRAVAERKTIVGFDVMELAPAEGPEASAYTAAKLTYKLIGYATQLRGS
jgi:agmatinase